LEGCDSFDERYAIIKSFKPRTEGIEVDNVYEYISIIIPKFPCDYKPSKRFEESNENYPYFIREAILGNVYKSFQLEVYVEPITQINPEKITRSEINEISCQEICVLLKQSE
jgi:hypothetical protein